MSRHFVLTYSNRSCQNKYGPNESDSMLQYQFMLGKVGVPVMEVRSIERELQIEKEKEEPLVQHQQSDLQKWQSHELLGGDNLPSRFDEALIVVNRGCHYKKRTIYSHIPPAQRPVMVYGIINPHVERACVAMPYLSNQSNVAGPIAPNMIASFQVPSIDELRLKRLKHSDDHKRIMQNSIHALLQLEKSKKTASYGSHERSNLPPQFHNKY
eukprot:scaffold9431_cov267-Chaetoceros_neogracile.AAC.1